MSFSHNTALQLSERLLQEAARWVGSHLSDPEWMRNNRKLSREWERAEWVLPGCNRLTTAEMEALRTSVAQGGWTFTSVRPEFHNPATNWELFVSLRPGLAEASERSAASDAPGVVSEQEGAR